MKKRSFFERLSGATPLADDDYLYEDELSVQQTSVQRPASASRTLSAAPTGSSLPASRNAIASLDDEPEGQLPVDVYQTPNDIVIRTFVAGVRPEELNVSISRDMVVIEGAREEREQVVGSDYFTQELFWGSFSRTVLLPQEIDVDTATAVAKDGLLTLVLPRLDKTRQTKLRIKAG